MQKSRFSRTWTAALAGAALLVAGASPAIAQAGAPAAPAAGGLLPADIARALEGRGYTAIRDVEFDDGVWEVEATSSAGTPVDLTLDPSGKVLHEEPDDDDD